MKIVKREDQVIVDKSTTPEHMPMIQVTDLPSKFLPYPDGTKVFYKPYTFGELEKISGSNLSFADLSKIIMAGIETVGITKGDLDYQDYLYIAVLRKLSTFSKTTFSASFKCPYCQEQVTASPELAMIEWGELDGIPELPLSVSIGGADLDFKSLTVDQAGELEMLGYTESDIHTLAAMVSNVEFDAAYELLSNLTDGDDIAVVTMIRKLLDFGSQSTTIVCPNSKCKSKVKVTVRGIARIAEPFRQSPETILNRILHGKTSSGGPAIN